MSRVSKNPVNSGILLQEISDEDGGQRRQQMDEDDNVNQQTQQLQQEQSSSNNQVNQAENHTENSEEESHISPEHFAKQIMSLMYPVSCCLILVVLLVRTIGQSNANSLGSVMVYQESESDGSGEKFTGALLNMVVFVAVIFGVTTLIVILYKFHCTKLIYAWLILSCVSLLGVFTMTIFIDLLELFNAPLDAISFYGLLWNFAAVGVLSIFWHSPLWIRQIYLIIMSAMMAYTLTKLPTWTTWGLLTGVSLWDLFAVLSPVGPLKTLVEESQERNEPIPGLVYETAQTTVLDHAMSRTRNSEYDQENTTQEISSPLRRSNDKENIISSNTITSNTPAVSSSSNDNNNNNNNQITSSSPSSSNSQQQQQQQQQGERDNSVQSNNQNNSTEVIYYEEDSSVKLGLGDFIFYSVLLARAALLDTWPTIMTCAVALLTGLCLTLFFLALFQRPLPALPMSIALGIIFYFLTSVVVDPFLKVLLQNQVFI